MQYARQSLQPFLCSHRGGNREYLQAASPEVQQSVKDALSDPNLQAALQRAGVLHTFPNQGTSLLPPITSNTHHDNITDARDVEFQEQLDTVSASGEAEHADIVHQPSHAPTFLQPSARPHPTIQRPMQLRLRRQALIEAAVGIGSGLLAAGITLAIARRRRS